jgi:hypothetical protein
VATVPGFDYSVLDVKAISDVIRNLGIVACDICKTGKASNDVFMRGPGEVTFLKRYCDQCIMAVNGHR